MSPYRLVVFDMAGTTIADHGEVGRCFLQAARRTGLPTTSDQLQPLRGLSKRQVFEELWAQYRGADAGNLRKEVDASYAEFRRMLENYYQTAPLEPTEGCLECFGWLRSEGIAIGLTSGFYRKVADIILGRLGWNQGLDAQYVGTAETIIQVSVTSDQVACGRPAPDMIQRAMELLEVSDPGQVIKVGDTPADLGAGRNAGCGLTLAVTNGSHTAEQLRICPNDGLLETLLDLKDLLQI